MTHQPTVIPYDALVDAVATIARQVRREAEATARARTDMPDAASWSPEMDDVIAAVREAFPTPVVSKRMGAA